MNYDTIAAISTPMGEGGIAIIRVSGDASLLLVDAVFQSRQKLTDAESHTVSYGFIVNPKTSERIEEVLVTVMRAPRSFTMENVVEIGCHGGLVSVKRVLDLLLEQGIRLAEPGEFTKRAFLNGRIDLTQAEAVIDLIRAKSDRAFKLAMKQSEGVLARKIRQLRDQLVETMAHIEVNIDYPEHDVEELTNSFIRNKCGDALEGVINLLSSASQGKIIREGIETAIVGRPNVGKSSLLNAMTQENKAIVTEIPGTTRDVIEEYVSVNGIPLKLLDTAGIRETNDIVERIGVERSKVALSEAELVLIVVNGNESLQSDELELIHACKDRNCIIIVNKSDLLQEIDLRPIYEWYPIERVVRLSAQNHEGLEHLEKAITALLFSGGVDSGDMTYVSNVRHIHLLKQAKQSLEDAISATGQYVPIDMIQIDIRNAWEKLGEVIGDAIGESLIDEIFSRFCLGK